MPTQVRRQIARLLSDKRHRHEYLAALALLALVVTVGVASILTQQGHAATKEVQVLDCHFDGIAAHTHDASCYDEDGNLVCPLPEREAHVHDDSCYVEDRVLTCDLAEGEEHTHDDSCYEVVRTLVCGQDEVAETHVHGAGCFRTVEVPVEDEAEPQAADQTDAPASPGAESAAALAQDPTLAETHPEQSFYHEFKDADDQLVMRVDVKAKAGALPKGTTMEATWVDPETLSAKQQDAVGDAIAAKAEGQVLGMQAVDITFRDADGAEVEPRIPVTVTFVTPMVDTDDQALVVHIDDLTEAQKKAQEKALREGKTADEAEPRRTAEAVEALSDQALAERDVAAGDDRLSFDSDSFSTYVLAVTSLHKVMQASDGATVTVTVDAPAEAGIPQGAELQVREVAQGGSDWQGYVQRATGMLDVDEVQMARFFDIAILGEDGQEIQPTEPVSVDIALADAPSDADASVVHFGAEGDQVVGATEDDGVASFQADGFSVWGVVYTVDFHWDVNGASYDYSVKGGDAISLRELVQQLGIVSDEGEALELIERIADVTFSDPELVAVARIDNDTTVGAIKEQQGLEPQYSADITDERVAEIDGRQLFAPDWMLLMLQSFSSEESLTITMKNGDVFTIRVTDDATGVDFDTKTNGVKPGTIDTYDNRAAGLKINLFDFGPDRLDNVGNTYNSPDNSGINQNHDLKFYSYGTNGSTINNFTGGAYANQGVVRSGLGTDGYPITSTSRGESLAYLFDPDKQGQVNGRIATYRDVTGLFQQDENGYLRYDSDRNYAYYQQDSNSFKVYNTTYMEEGADSDSPFGIGFFPFNDYNNKYRCIHGDNFNWGCKGSKDRNTRDQVGHYNHHFGMTVEGKFYMTEDKKVNGNDIIFDFSGDDDMWVFIDGVLVLDIGGIHNPVAGHINFTTGQVSVSSVKTASGGGAYALGANTTIQAAFDKYNQNNPGNPKVWDDNPLTSHDIKIFYMERGGMYSNLAITMNLPTYPEPKSVELDKVNNVTPPTGLAGAEFKLYSDEACTQEVTQDKVAVVVTSSESPLGKVVVDGLIPTMTYYMKEVVPPTGYKLDDTVYKILAHEGNDETQVWKKSGSEWVVLEAGNRQIINEPEVYKDLDFTKVDAKNHATKVGGATFTLYESEDLTTVAKNKDGHNLVATSDSATGKVSFKDIPEGTFYMKETATPDGYLPSDDIYRVVVDQSGVQVLKLRSDDQALTVEDNTLLYPNTPKNEKTSISVEKIWEDGNSNHTNDTVTVQLYDKVTEKRVSGGKIDLTVAVNEWVDTDGVTAEAPNNGSISYKITNDAGEREITGTLPQGGNWSNTHQDLKAMEDGEYITYTVTVTNTDGTVVQSAEVSGNDTVQGADGTVYLQGTVKPSTQGGIVIDASRVNFGDNKSIRIEDIKLQKQGNNTSWYGDVNPNDWPQSNIEITSSSQNVITLSSSETALANSGYGYHFKFTGNNLQPNERIYIRITPRAFNYGDSSDPRYEYTLKNDHNNDHFTVPETGEQIRIELSSTPFTNASSTSSGAKVSRRPSMAKALSSDEIASTGEETQGSPATTVTNYEVTLNSGEVGWSYTWSDLPKSENYTEGDYSCVRTHEYYVKEVSVNLAHGTDDDIVTSSYSYEYNVHGDKTSGIKAVKITNKVMPKTSLSVTKEWYGSDGKTPYEPNDSEKTVEFDLYQQVEGQDATVREHGTITYADGAWSKAEFADLPLWKKVGDDLKPITYYVQETSPVADGTTMVTYYLAGDKTFTEASDAAADATTAQSETIVNVNSRREINITKQWYVIDNNGKHLASEPTVKTVYFKLGMMQGDTDQGFYNNGEVFDLNWVEATDDTPAHWATKTFDSLDFNYQYYIVETNASGTPILADESDTKSLQVSYTDVNGDEVDADHPFRADVPGTYTINNVEKKTTLYADKVWQTNKENIVGDKDVWFGLYRVLTDGNTCSGTPELVKTFSMSEKSSWTHFFDDIEIAPYGQTDTYKYYQYYVQELGFKEDGTEPIEGLNIRYQSKGSGAERPNYMSYSQGATAPANNAAIDVAWLNDNATKVRVKTWDKDYDGTGTLGVFNSENEYLSKPLAIEKQWFQSDGITEVSKDDGTTVEIQLMQTAKVNGTTIGSCPYGKAFIISKDSVLRNSDLFQVVHGSGDWQFTIPEKVTKEGADVDQLPASGPFTYEGQTYTNAQFTYYVSEYRVYDANDHDVTTEWTSACQKDNGDGTVAYTLQLMNRPTNDLTLHKAWADDYSRTYANSKVKAVLYKLYQGEHADKTGGSDITEMVARNPQAYGLGEQDVYYVRTVTHGGQPVSEEDLAELTADELASGDYEFSYDYYIALTKPATGWGTDVSKQLTKLPVVKPVEDADGLLTSWTNLNYWVQETMYMDTSNAVHPIADLLHGNAAGYPKYGSSTTGVAELPTSDSATESSPSVTLTAGEGKAHLRATNTVRGLDVVLKKNDAETTSKYLNGAKFKLTKLDDKEEYAVFSFSVVDKDNAAVTVSSDGEFTVADGSNGVTIKGLLPGSYQLEETLAPNGYILLGQPVQFTVSYENGEVAIAKDVTTDSSYDLGSISGTNQKSATVTVHNTPGKPLPNAGGVGTEVFTVVGAAMMAVAGAMLLRRRRMA